MTKIKVLFAALEGCPGFLASWRDGAIATSLAPAPEETGSGGAVS